MKAVKNILIYGCIAVAGLFVLSCNPEPQPDPCAGVKATSADFKIEEVVEGADDINKPVTKRFEVEDTVSFTKILTLTAQNDLDEYYWQIGTDTTIRREKSFQLSFDNPVGRIRVRLVGKKKPNLNCNPGDSGVDTVTKYITVVKAEDLILWGKYIGHYDNTPNQLDTVILMLDKINPGVLTSGVLRNIPQGCTCNQMQIIASQAFYTCCAECAPGCFTPMGWGYVKKGTSGQTTLEVELTKWDTEYKNRISQKFKGVKHEDL